MAPENRYIECLFLTQTFETFWAYYSQSGGNLYGPECKKSMSELLVALDDISKIDQRFSDHVQMGFSEEGELTEFVSKLRAWVAGDEPVSHGTFIESRVMLYDYFKRVKELAGKCLGIPVYIGKMQIGREFEYSEGAIRWKGYLPQIVKLWDKLDTIFESASRSETIVVIGDVRRSQDLMTFAPNPQVFADYMGRFIHESRRIISENYGVFDKFTGDGFIAYFNETVCKEFNVDYTECFLKFSRMEMEFANELFNEWRGLVRKSPAELIGLSIGADTGEIDFLDKDHHLIAIGDAIVWAQRMVSVGKAGEIVINNLLGTQLQGHDGLEFEYRPGKTRAGESFMAQILNFK